MRGELIGVWPDAWREIWLPLSEEPTAPEDMFSELYRELITITKSPSEDLLIKLGIEDALQSREAFHRAFVLAGMEIQTEIADQLYALALLQDPDEPPLDRRTAFQDAITKVVSRPIEAEALLSQAVREIVVRPERRDEARNRVLEKTFNDPQLSTQAFQNTSTTDLIGEKALVGFFEASYRIFEESGGDALSNRYFLLLERFLEKYSLRYQLRRPCQLCPTLQGVFSGLIRELRTISVQDQHLDMLMKEFESAIRDLRTDLSEGKIKTCIQKQVNLLEGIGAKCPGVTEGELGKICHQLTSWPHPAVKAALGNIYGFTSDYPGIRHGGNPKAALRQVEMRDLIAITILLTGFSPYLINQLNTQSVYSGN